MQIGSLRKFPKRNRVLYARNPLVEVVCAVNFPPLLELREAPPSAFQRRFAKEYPFVQVHELIGVFGVGPRNDAPPDSRKVQSTYEFSDPSKQWSVSLEPSVLALTCRKYTEWREFRERFESVLKVAGEIFEIGLISRLGLRYKDVIDKRNLGLETHPWTDLIKAEALATFLFFTDDLELGGGAGASLEVAIPPGLAKIQIMKVASSATKSIGLLIDTDCFVQRDQPFDAAEIMRQGDELHEYTSTVFHACITDFLHDQLQRP